MYGLEEMKKSEIGVLENGQEGVKKGSYGQHIPVSHFQVSPGG